MEKNLQACIKEIELVTDSVYPVIPSKFRTLAWESALPAASFKSD